MDKTITKVYWATFEHPIFKDRELYIAKTERGICRITWPTESFDTLNSWVEKQMPNAELVEDHDRLRASALELTEYFDGKRTTFSEPLDMIGTPFQVSVWKALTEIPFGETCSYSDIAQKLDNPKAVRAVGTANGANPIPIIVPCHRVIGKSNALTGFRGGLKVKEQLLQLEGYDDYTAKGHARFQF
ncbi:methylated-DNA--[protein]-cysteine S-methyltransferase [Pseudalkalibacillus berkeleyi]|uniref:Methylated-DNA--protein-cysteine methyltransferase n=1 Tax=Pseudalkalibacillus berkeleyi TaxID=1069813 RepID=A0ABS9H0X1_9BACL|nr:methylated-DNA--[protein]-cysteine S-methyltransferase [Pseudalkalibacillus berkeleyi]MCF6138649.1 methylated-DNA--[protein]-cysteine S-methyltransferase [Pseudalkalibacillus berkeleyi]